jgi:HSP20 family protein
MLLHSATDRLSARVSACTSPGARLKAYRLDETFHIDIELPGVDPADIEITADGDVLTVRAERRPGGEDQNSQPAEPVSRQMLLSDTLDTDRLDARFENGVLTLRIPVREKPVSDRISTS